MTGIYKNAPIRFKLFAVYAPLLLVIFSFGFSLLYFQTKQSLEVRIKEELSKSNQVITDMVETAATVSIKNHLRAIAEHNRKIMENLYRDYQDKRLSETEALGQAVRILLGQKVGETGYIYCINSDGIVRVHPRKGVLGNDLSHHEFIRAQIGTKEGYLEYDWKNPEDAKFSRKALYMTYFEPWDWIISVSSYTSEFSSLVSVDDFKNRILGLTFGKTGYSFILDTSGTMLIHPEFDGHPFDRRNGDLASIIDEMVSRKNGFLSYVWKNPSETAGRKKIVAFSTIPEFDWIIASSSYVQEVFSPLSSLRKSFVAILSLTLLATGLVTLAVSATITKPLTRLVDTFEQGSSGDWSRRMDDSGNDELGKLSHSFNRFMDKLEVYKRDLVAENTERKVAENQLQTLRNYLSNIINSMPSMLIGVDGHMNVTQWNKTCEKITGISMEDACGSYLPDLFPRIQSQTHQIQQSLDLAQIQQCVKVPYAADNGTTRYEEVTIYPLAENGCQGAVIRIDDVTEKINMEEVLIQNEKMLSVGRLAAGMAHEINNPLAGVIQNAAVLINRLTDRHMPANISAAVESGTTMDCIHRYMSLRDIPHITAAINQSSARMTSIVNNMLNFSRKSDASASSHDLAVLMDKSLELSATDYDLKKHYDFKSIVIEKHYEPDLPLVNCDGSKLQQVFMNILGNAAQALFDDPTVSRRQSQGRKPTIVIRLWREIDSNRLQIEIQDNGAGMDEMTLKRIFEPFFTTKPAGVGTGLGLSISYFIITENHGGTLDVVSENGKGSTFIIGLPLDGNRQ